MKLLYVFSLTVVLGFFVLKCANEDNDSTEDTPRPDVPIDSPYDFPYDPPDIIPDTALDISPDFPVDLPVDTAVDVSTDIGTDTSPGGDLCDTCEDNDDCGGPQDYCLRNLETGEVFCGKWCNSPSDCPSGFICVEVTTDGGTINQCVPESGTCGDIPEDCVPPCGPGEVCRDGVCVPESSDDQQHCVDVINEFRSRVGRAPLSRSSSLESCATEGAEYDAFHGTPHGHFRSTGGCGGVAWAENELPGWPLGSYGSIRTIIEEGTAMMWAEGPGGGHYENIIGPYTSVGCGIYITSANNVWVVQDFR